MLTRAIVIGLITANIKPDDRQIDIEMVADQIAGIIIESHDARVTGLLQHNNELEERARVAEREVNRLTKSLLFGAALIGELSRIGNQQ